MCQVLKQSVSALPEKPISRHKLALVVVDDDQQIRRIVGRFLRSCGHDVRIFESAEAYLAESSAADCAILDIQLPGMTGLELEERMRHERRGLGVVFITAHDDAGTRAAIEKRHRQLLMKPFDEDHLLAAIAKATSAD